MKRLANSCYRLFRRKPVELFLQAVSIVLIGPLFLLGSVFSRVFQQRQGKQLRLLWGTEPIINNSYWSRAMREAGWDSETFTTMYYSINEQSDWDRVLDKELRWLPTVMRPYLGFLQALLQYDVFFLSFRGLFLGDTIMWRSQNFLLRLAGKKIVVLPYGSDAYVYRRIRNLGTVHGLMMSYPGPARMQRRTAARVDYWTKRADAVIPGFMGIDGLGRWEVCIPSKLFIDLADWKVTKRKNNSAGHDLPLIIAHSPNHRGFKGTEFLVEAAEILQAEGLKVELLILEGVPNQEVKLQLAEGVDILVEQLIADGHGMSAIEGMASGLPVIANLGNEDSLVHFRRWSFLDECPIVSASPENIVEVLRVLAKNPELRQQIGRASREYVEKYHGLDSAQYLFENVIAFLEGRKEDLLGLYHPLTGYYPNRSPKIKHPLRINRIPKEFFS